MSVVLLACAENAPLSARIRGRTLRREQPLQQGGLVTGKKVFIRTDRVYVGPVPTESEVRTFVARGQADAFWPYLRVRGRPEEAAALVELETALDRLEEDIDAATEDARNQARGTTDEHVMPAQRSRLADDSVAALKRRAQEAGDLVVTEIRGETAFHAYLRRTRFPGLFDMRKEQERMLRERFRLARTVMEQAFDRHGLGALDVEQIETVFRADQRGSAHPHVVQGPQGPDTMGAAGLQESVR